MKTSDFSYDLPKRLIAQEPAPERHKSRLMVVDRSTGHLEHKSFCNIVEYLKAGDCLVLNNTRVIPARITGICKDTGSSIELLLVNKIDEKTWEAMAKPGKKAKPGRCFVFGNGALQGFVTGQSDNANKIIRFEYDGDFEKILNNIGQMPFPPYITKTVSDAERYQTVYSTQNGSVAAPTAGLHFTTELLESIRLKGIEIAVVTLHVGPGTFLPVRTEQIEDHRMHPEFYIVDEKTAGTINRVRLNGGRIIAVGTTSCRVLETASDESGLISPGSGWTNIFIYPGYHFKAVDALLTNFHLPESTLIMLVSAFAGTGRIKYAYAEAIKEEYRFFSFGDAMLII